MRASIAIIFALSVLALAGCQTRTGGEGLVRPQLPPLPERAVSGCARPTVALGDDLGVAALEWKATARCEAGKRAALVTYYGTLQTGLAGE